MDNSLHITMITSSPSLSIVKKNPIVHIFRVSDDCLPYTCLIANEDYEV